MSTNILYAYDSEKGSFSALPASPWLLPAIGIFALLAFYNHNRQSKVRVLDESPNIDMKLFNEYRIRYKELLDKKYALVNGGLTIEESIELQGLIRPPWAEPGELWTYY